MCDICTHFPFCNASCKDQFEMACMTSQNLSFADPMLVKTAIVPDGMNKMVFAKAPEWCYIKITDYCRIYGLCPWCKANTARCTDCYDPEPDVVMGYDGIYNSNL